MRAERGRLVQVLGEGCRSHFGVVSGKGSDFRFLCSRQRVPPLWELSVHPRAIFGMDAKSGGTACFHVLMMDGEAFYFCFEKGEKR